MPKYDGTAGSGEISVLKDDQIKVNETVTKEMLNVLDKDAEGNALAADQQKLPVLAITAYAVQKDNMATAADAWAAINAPANP